MKPRRGDDGGSDTAAHRFRFVTRWHLAHPSPAVWTVLEDLVDTEDPFVWWDDLVVTGRDDDEVHVHALSHVGYRLRLRLHSLRARPREHVGFDVDGDLLGAGRLELVDGGPESCVVVITWDVRVTRPWMRAGSRVLRPVFVMTHAIVMRRGRRGLDRWLTHHAKTPDGH